MFVRFTAFFFVAVCLCAVGSEGMAQITASPAAQTQPAPNARKTPIDALRRIVVFMKLSCEENGKLYDVNGTGFLVSSFDSRLPTGKQYFVYLVTNRHVALCWDEHGHPMTVRRISVLMNRNQDVNGSFVTEEIMNANGNVPWTVPDDDSVDLAALPFVPNRQIIDALYISLDEFATTDVLQQHRMGVGDPLFFAGFFYQFPGTKRILPIIRQGIMAMMPDEKIPFVTNPEWLYLADVHAFGGNSGAPAFVNLAGLHGEGLMLAPPEYRLIGVVNGLMTEDENFNLELTTTFKGRGAANSGVSTIVPADELKALINGSKLQAFRDRVVFNVTHQNAAK